MDPALGLGVRHPLDPVDPALKFQPAVHPLAVHRKDSFPHAPQLGFAEVQKVQLPAAALGIHGVHPQQAAGKQGGFLAAHTAADLHNHAAAVVFIFGQQKQFERIFQLRRGLRFFADFLLYHGFEVRLQGVPAFEQGFCLCQVIQLGLPGPVGLDHRLCLVILLHQLAEPGGVGGGVGLVEPLGQFLKAAAHRLHLLFQCQCSGSFLHSCGLCREKGY